MKNQFETTGETVEIVEKSYEKHNLDEKPLTKVLFTGFVTHKKREDGSDELKPFEIITFKTTKGVNLQVPASYDLRRKLEKETDMCGFLYTIERTPEKDVDTGEESKMKTYKVTKEALKQPVSPNFLNS